MVLYCGDILYILKVSSFVSKRALNAVAKLYSDEISSRIPMSESSYSITQKEYLKSIYGNYK